MVDKNYYEILGVSEDSTTDDIKKNYRKLAVKYHPDKGESESDDKMKEINEAYSVLSDDNKRRQYDMERKYGPMGGGHGGQGFSDIFNDMFHGGMGRRRRDPNAPMKGRDINYLLNIPIRFFIFGGLYSLNLKYRDVCVKCQGTGAEEKSTCNSCGGQGQQTHRQQQGNTVFINTVPCNDCGGRGFVATKKCQDCEDGSVYVEKEVEIEVPKNIKNGHVLQKKGFGFSGKNGGPPGDLYVKLDMDLPKEEELNEQQREVIRGL